MYLRSILARSLPLLAHTSGTNNTNATTGGTAPSLGIPQAQQQSWGGYSPWYPAEMYASPPSGCEVVQVHLIQRHGARYPTTAPGKAMQKSVQKLQAAKQFMNTSFNFIKTYKYTLGSDSLVAYGAAQSFDAGHDHYERYESLVNETMLPFVRASESDRVMHSAANWTAGFADASGGKLQPSVSVIISEKSNNTLDNNMCPASGKSEKEKTAWVQAFTPKIVARFKTAAPGVDVNGSDIVNYMSMCPFDTVASEASSKWCGLFSSDEWASYEYFGDLDYFYGNGYGQKLGRVQGVGYVNELIARLTGQPVQDETQMNRTLDENLLTFPLNRTFYADFSHDNEIISIYGALGLFNQTEDLSTQTLDMDRTWVASKMVPFSGRMITEKLTCQGKEDAYVRVLVNDAVQTIEACQPDVDGMCTLSNFVKSQSYAQENGNGDWALCDSGSGGKGGKGGGVTPKEGEVKPVTD